MIPQAVPLRNDLTSPKELLSKVALQTYTQGFSARAGRWQSNRSKRCLEETVQGMQQQHEQYIEITNREKKKRRKKKAPN